MCSVEGPPLRAKRPQPMADDQPYPIYLDHNATTPVSDEAWAAMLGCRDTWGNPSSTHPYGLQSKFVVENARRDVANAIGATPDEVIFTSGGTESNNLAIIGAAEAAREANPGRNVILSTVFEHDAVTNVLTHLTERCGFVVHRLPVDGATGRVDVTVFQKAVDEHADKLALVTVMHANNELGTIQPIADLVRAVKAHPAAGKAVAFHVDASQSLGKLRIRVNDLGCDFLTVCSHKFYGPKGVGALYRRAGAALNVVQFGAKQEGGQRPGTENIILVAGMAAALRTADEQLEKKTGHMRQCRDALRASLEKYAKGRGFELQYNVPQDAHVLPNTLNVSFYYPPADMYISSARLQGSLATRVAVAAGAACHAVADDSEIPVSSSLKAVKVHPRRAMGTLRLSTGLLCQLGDMDRAAQMIMRAASQQMPADV